MEELSRSVTAHVLVVVSDVGSNNGQAGEQNGDKRTVKSSKHRTLLGVIGQAALGRLGDDALAGIAQVVNHHKYHKEGEAGGLRQFVGHMEQNKAGAGQDQVADDDKRTVLAELAVGLIQQKAYEGVGDTVPDAHHHGQGRGEHHADADPAQQIVGDIVHQEHIQVGSGVVQRKAADAPQRNAVDAVGLVVLVVELIRQGSQFSHKC